MPRIILKLYLRGSLKKNLGKAMRKRIYFAISKWNSWVLTDIVSKAPRYSGPDPRRKPGFLARHIGLVNTESEGISYKAIGIKGSGPDAYHAFAAIIALHEGWSAPFTRKPRGKIMTFPLGRATFRKPEAAAPAPGGGGSKTWVITKKATQIGGPTRNPWIWAIVDESLPTLGDLIEKEANKAKGKRIRIEIS